MVAPRLFAVGGNFKIIRGASYVGPLVQQPKPLCALLSRRCVMTLTCRCHWWVRWRFATASSGGWLGIDSGVLGVSNVAFGVVDGDASLARVRERSLFWVERTIRCGSALALLLTTCWLATLA